MLVSKDKNKIRFNIYTLGCKVNQYDSAVLKNLLLLGNFILSKNQKSDLFIINSCSVTKIAIAKSRKLINVLKKKSPQAKIILIGCWPKIYEIEDLKVDLILSEKNINKVAELIFNSFPLTLRDLNLKNNRGRSVIQKNIRGATTNIFQNNKTPSIKTSGTSSNNCFLNVIEDRSRYFIKIQDGCQQFCSYCVIPLARGSIKSRRPSDIIKEIKQAVNNGFSEVVLSGIHLGLYGQDLDNKRFSQNNKNKKVNNKENSRFNLHSLLKEILKIKNLGRLRLSSIEITEVNDEIIDLIANNKKMCRHLHIPLQSGDDIILSLMNRPYNSKYFLDQVKKIRKKIPNISISTDIIVGFPGESHNNFRNTYNFSKKINFSKIHVFSFSAHEKTPAFYLPHRVLVNDIKDRSKKLRDLSKDLEKKYQQKILNQNQQLNFLIESFGDKVRLKSEYYFDYFLSFDKFLNNCFFSNNDYGELIFLENNKREQDKILGKIITCNIK